MVNLLAPAARYSSRESGVLSAVLLALLSNICSFKADSGGRVMRRANLIAITVFLLFAVGATAQQTSTAPPSGGDSAAPPVRHLSTIRGCLDGDRGNYILVEHNSSVYVLKGVGNKLDSYLRKEVEVKGRMLPGTIKTGVRAEKAGSNPSDTVHGVDGVPFQVADVPTDIRLISKHCKAADQE
jgi:hypothetical protein